jgi:hypothetical protein
MCRCESLAHLDGNGGGKLYTGVSNHPTHISFRKRRQQGARLGDDAILKLRVARQRRAEHRLALFRQSRPRCLLIYPSEFLNIRLPVLRKPIRRKALLRTARNLRTLALRALEQRKAGKHVRLDGLNSFLADARWSPPPAGSRTHTEPDRHTEASMVPTLIENVRVALLLVWCYWEQMLLG